MTVIKKTYGNESEFRADWQPMNTRGFSVRYHDSPFIITWVTSDERTQPSPKRTLTESAFIRELADEKRVIIT